MDNLNKNNRQNIDDKIQELEAENNFKGHESSKAVQKSGIKQKLSKLLPGKHNS